MKYYFSKLDSKEKDIYKVIYYGLKNFDENIKTTPKNLDVKKIFNMVLYDNPEFFYINPCRYSFIKSFKNITIIPEYIYTKKEAKEIKLKIDSVTKPILNKLKSIPQSLERERYIHKYIINDIKYKYTISADDIDAHTIVGSFIHKKAVCDGISKAFKYLCDKSKISSNIVEGNAITKDNNFESHAWNMVEIDKNWYHIDVTWDMTLMENDKYVRYDYFNVTDTDILKDHKDFDKYERCINTECNFFYINNSIINSKKDLKRFFDFKIKQIRNNNSKKIYFKINSEKFMISINDIGRIFESSCNKNLFFIGGYNISFNKLQNIYIISFS